MTTSASQCQVTAYKQAGTLDHDSPTFPGSIAWEHARIESEDLALNASYQPISELTAARGTTGSHRTGAEVGGSLTGKLVYNDLHQDMLASLLGEAWAADELVPGLTLDLWTIQKLILQGDGVTTDYHRFFNSTVGSLQLTIPAEGVLEQSITMVGGHMDSDFTETTTPTYPADSPVIGSAPAIDQEGVTIVWGGGLATPLQGFCIGDFALTIDSQNRQKRCIGELGGQGLLGELAVSGTASIYFDDSTAMAAFLAQTTGTLAITLVDTATSPNTLLIELDNVALIGTPLPIEGTGTDMIYQVAFEAHEVSGGDQVRITRTPGP